MKVLNKIIALLLLSFVMFSFSQCSSTQKLQKEAPTTFNEVYCQSWIGGVQGGGSGINIFIPVKDASVILDSVYFRGQVEKLVTEPGNDMVYVGHFMTDLNQLDATKKDLNTKLSETNIPFELKDNECVVSYQDGTATKYYKIEQVVEKAPIAMPSAPPNNNN